ncbi:MAG: porin family protein [Gammaproteobacteria bacterium]|nr:porin family protein [Gammaproteobacteria bacterium]
MIKWHGLIQGVLVALLSVVALQAVAIPAANQAKVALSPALGYAWFDSKRDLDSNWLPNVALGYYFDNHWRVQFRLGGFNANRRKAGAKSGHGMLYSGDGFYYLFPHWRVEPYLVAGLGTMVLSRPRRNDASVQANFSAGAGLEYFLDQTASLYVGARDLYTPVGGKNDIMVDVGISFFLFRVPVDLSRVTGAGQQTVESTQPQGQADEEGIITVGLGGDDDANTNISAAQADDEHSGVIVVGAEGGGNS